MRTLPLVAGLLLVGSTPAFAHIVLTFPAARAGDMKKGPCAGPTRGSKTTAFEPGATITVTWDETIPHEGHYRLAFDDSGQDFAIPSKIEATDGRTILADGIPDPSGGQKKFQQVVKLPDIECDNCTLQLIQVMSTAPSNWSASQMYFQCADLVLRRGAGNPSPPGDGGGSDGTVDDPTTGDATGGCSAGDAPGILLLLAAVPLRRRRRS